MRLSNDLREFVESLNSRAVDYVIVGAHSLAFHGRPRLLTSISGVTTDDAFATKMPAELDGIPVFILSKDALIRNKRAVGRPQDLADLDTLEE